MINKVANGDSLKGVYEHLLIRKITENEETVDLILQSSIEPNLSIQHHFVVVRYTTWSDGVKDIRDRNTYTDLLTATVWYNQQK